MAVIIKFVADIAIWLYLLLAITGFLVLLAVRASVRELSQSIFDLERDHATARLTRYISYFVLVCIVAGSIYYVDTELIKQIPLPEATPTPTPIAALPDTPTPPPLPTPTPTPTRTPRPSAPTESVEITPTPLLETQSGSLPNCPQPGVHITQPGNGATVSGAIQIIGTARIDNFAYYKIEFRLPGRDWNFIESYETPAGEGYIASWNTATVPPGVYELRLVVVDNTGNFPEPCQIQLNVVQ